MRRYALQLLIFMVAWCMATPCFADSYDQHLESLKVDDESKVIMIYMDDQFAQQSFTGNLVKKIYKRVTKDVHKQLPHQYKDYDVRIYSKGLPIETYLTRKPVEEPKKHRKHGGWWGDTQYDGKPWVSNLSKPHKTTAALNGKHISLWASHGKYYDEARNIWKWQRPRLFCTSEDLFTQTIVVPFLIPMLENAGANVFTPRERDWQTEEIIIDNDGAGYYEANLGNNWSTASIPGFATPQTIIPDNYNPFTAGTIRQTETTKTSACSKALYKPTFTKAGRYAVYVSYATLDRSIDNVHYTVHHQGMRTEFSVNQQMGGGTWVYLGTFDFDSGCSENNCVEVSSFSEDKGVVTTDAVRFGGGMGNITRGTAGTSGLPRCLEGARYYAQWAGMPYSEYSLYDGKDDYKDDINVRSLMTNWLAGGSAYVPDRDGKHVPIDLSLAVHSDAGYDKDMQSIFGSLAVCTTDFNEGKLATGHPRTHSKDFAQMLLDQTKKDIMAQYGKWKWRDLYDKNYSESRMPSMPSAIFETLSHQSFPDMKFGHDPNFKFTLARSIYKTILHFEAEAHGEKAIVSPLTPENFRITLDTLGNANLVWTEQKDPDEPSARPTSYNVYMSMGGNGYDNGLNVNMTSHTVRLMPDLQYRFRITAVNAGGESFPSEELSVVWHEKNAPTVLVINGFQRLATPEVIDNDSLKGFDMDSDPGVSYGLTAGWCGKQQDYTTTSPSLGSSSSELEGRFACGNTFTYVAEHVAAIASAYQYNVVSATRSVVEYNLLNLSHYDVIDIILGNERNDGYSLKPYKTFTTALQQSLFGYALSSSAHTVTGHHALLVSGSYVASDMKTIGEQAFLRELLHIEPLSTVRSANNYVKGLQQTLVITGTANPDHYATTQSDVLKSQDHAFVSMQYNDGQTAAVAYKGKVSTFTMGFPFECITNSAQRAYTMRGILAFLTSRP